MWPPPKPCVGGVRVALDVASHSAWKNICAVATPCASSRVGLTNWMATRMTELDQDAQQAAAPGDVPQGDDQKMPSRKREIRVCANPSGPDQISHKEWDALDRDPARLKEFIRQRDAEREANAEA